MPWVAAALRHWLSFHGTPTFFLLFLFGFVFFNGDFFFYAFSPQSWEAAKQPRLRVLTPIIVSLLHFHDTFYLREEPRQGSSAIEARREGCGLDSSGRGVRKGAGERAKVGLKSTRKGFYCSGVTACLRTCAPKRKMFLKKKNHFSKWNCARMLPRRINVGVWLFKASQRVRQEQNKTFKTMVAPDAGTDTVLSQPVRS